MTGNPVVPVAADAQRLESVLSLAAIAWWEMDCDTGAVRFHRRKTDILGYDAAAFTHYSHFTALLHPDDHAAAMQAMRDHLSGALPDYRVDYRIRAHSGEYRWFEDIGRISLRDDAGRPVTITGIVTDITQRRAAEEALGASEERFRGMFHGHTAVKLIIDPSTGEIVDANEAAAQFYGWSVVELKRMRIQQINDLPPNAVEDRISSAVASSRTHFEFRHRRADGSVKDVEVYSTAVALSGRALLYSIIHDISDRKQVEQALLESEARLRMLVENMADALWVMDDETGRFRFVTPSIERIGGYSAEEFMSRDVLESIPEERYRELRALREARLEEFSRGIERTYVDIVEQTRRDGTQVIVEVHGRFVRNVHSGRIEVIGVSRDITERRRVEEALRVVHDRLRHAEDFARFGHWEIGLRDRVLHASDGALQVYGFTESNIPLAAIQACALAEYRPGLDAALQALIERGAPYDQEFKIRRAVDGEVRYVHSRAEYDAAAQRVFGVAQDITDRKRIEEEREGLIAELQHAIEHVKTLTGIVPMCASCKKIRDDRGYWEQVEAYVTRHTDAQFSHGICPECMERLYPGM